MQSLKMDTIVEEIGKKGKAEKEKTPVEKEMYRISAKKPRERTLEERIFQKKSTLKNSWKKERVAIDTVETAEKSGESFLIRSRDERNFNYFFTHTDITYFEKEKETSLIPLIEDQVFTFRNEPLSLDEMINKKTGKPLTEEEKRNLEEEKEDIACSFYKESNKKAMARIIAQFMASSCDRYKLDDENESNRNIVPLINAFYNAETDEMITCNDERFNSFKKEHIFTRHFSVKYNQAAKDCPQFMSVLDYLTEGNENLKRDILHAIACLFINGNKEQKFIFLLGTGGNGKSTLLDVIGAMMNKDKSDSSFYSKWEKDMLEKRTGATHQERLHAARFARGVIGSEITQGSFDTEQMKALTGDTTTRTSGKGTKDEEYHNGKSFLVAINNFPSMSIDSGVERRIVTIPVDAPKVEQPVAGLVDKIVANELPAIFNILRPYIHSVAKGEAYEYSEETKKASEKALHANDDVYSWVSAQLENISSAQTVPQIVSRVPVEALKNNIDKILEAFNKAQMDKNQPTWKKRNFETRFFAELERRGWKKKRGVRMRKEDARNIKFCDTYIDLLKYQNFNGSCYINERNEQRKKDLLSRATVHVASSAV